MRAPHASNAPTAEELPRAATGEWYPRRLIPVLAGQHKTSRGDSVVILQELALRAVCNISATLTIKHEHVLSLLAALPPLLASPFPVYSPSWSCESRGTQAVSSA